MPAWIPGSYLIRDYARHVIAVKAESDGRAVPLRKIDKSTWRVAAGSGPLLLCAEIYANDLSARGAFLDAAHAFFNGVCLFFRVDGLTDERCVVHLAPPENLPGSAWKVATGLARLTGTDDEFGAFMASSYEELIDHPVLMGDLFLGRFEIGDVEHVIAITGHRDADMARLQRDLWRVCTAHGWG